MQKKIEYSKASVHGMLRALASDNLIYKSENNNYYLTEKGTEATKVYSTVCKKFKDELLKKFKLSEELAEKNAIICASSLTQDALFKIAEKE